LLNRLRTQGKTVILVTHKLREIMAVTDRVAVMRQGALVAEFATRDTTPGELAERMVGRTVSWQVEKSAALPGELRLVVKNLVVRDRRGVVRVKGVNFELRGGEIVGVAGVAGNGQSELLDALAGICRPTSGEIWLEGHELVRAALSPRARRRLGLAHVPEDRLRQGLVAEFSAQDNAILGQHDRPAYNRGWLQNRGAILAGTTGGSCITWGAVREVLIYGRQVRKQARDVSRWGRRNLLHDDSPRDLGVPTDQLALQRERESRYLMEREARRLAEGSTARPTDCEAEPSLARRLLAIRQGRARSTAAARRHGVEEPPS